MYPIIALWWPVIIINDIIMSETQQHIIVTCFLSVLLFNSSYISFEMYSNYNSCKLHIQYFHKLISSYWSQWSVVARLCICLHPMPNSSGATKHFKTNHRDSPAAYKNIFSYEPHYLRAGCIKTCNYMVDIKFWVFLCL